jgi:3-oxoacyl-[acyl-carrier protein] reductase
VPQLSLSNTIRPAVAGWTKSLSRELGPKGITVNCVAPGRIDTARMQELYGEDGPPAAELAQIPIGRLGRPRELADLVSFLASDRGSYITGTTIPVDGGSTRGLL